MTKDEKIKIIVMPISIVVMTAIFGGWVGSCLQENSFKKNALFQARLNMLMLAREEALAIRKDVDEARRQIRANETQAQEAIRQAGGDVGALQYARSYYCTPEYSAPWISVLKESRIRIESLRDEPKGDEKLGKQKIGEVNIAIDEFIQELGGYLACLNKEGCGECSKDHSEKVMSALNKIVSADTKAAEALISGK